MLRTPVKLAAVFLLAIASASAPLSAGFAPVSVGPSFSSIGPIAFGSDGTLFAADRTAATIVAVNLGAEGKGAVAGTKDVEGIDTRIAALLGTDAAGVTVTDLAVHPSSKNSFISVMRGTGPTAQAALVRVDGAGTISLVAMESLTFTSVALPNPPAVNPTGRGGRMNSVTDLAFVNGRVYVAGLSNEEFASKLWSVGYPFASVDRGASVEIYHGNHGALETRSPVMAFVPFTIGSELNILAGYTCTPLVKIPVAALKAGEKVVGTTVAEFGAGNQPLDLFAYKKDGKDFLLMSNSRRGVMKISTDGLATAQPITAPVGGTAGVAFETIASMVNIEQMDLLDGTRTIVIMRGTAGRNLTAVVLP
jgi:hypothetical protein